MSNVKTYFIQCVSGGPVKIGKSQNPEMRLRQIQGSCPSRMLLIGVINHDYEARLHRIFGDRNGLAGEWFVCDERLARAIKRLCGATAIADGRTSPPGAVGDYALPPHDWRCYVAR
jgi:hypothetical protein